jgi:hypothetical protein
MGALGVSVPPHGGGDGVYSFSISPGGASGECLAELGISLPESLVCV